MTDQAAKSDLSPPRGRLLAGAGVLIFGWLCPLFVPLVLGSDLTKEWKTVLSGLLFGLLRRLAPADTVSLSRYRIGLAMFLLPILFAWVSIYVPGREI